MEKNSQVLQSKIDKNLEKFKSKVTEDKSIKKSFVSDGVIDINEYIKSPIKILWVLKEVNSSDDDVRDMREALKTLREGNKIHKDWVGTFKPIVLASYGILNNKNWQQAEDEYEKEKSDVIECIKKVAFINVKKVAGKEKAYKKEIKEFAIKYADLLSEQMDIINPDVIVFGGSMEFIKDKSGYDKIKELDYFLHEYKFKGKLVIDTYHPNQRKITQELYCNSIINTIKNSK